jgi:acyl carrier protein
VGTGNISNISEFLCGPSARDAQATIMEETALKAELKQHIIKYLNLLDIKPEDIADAEPLFGENLGLDSIDALELSVLMEREYGIKITDPAEGRKILYDVNSMAAHILANKAA